MMPRGLAPGRQPTQWQWWPGTGHSHTAVASTPSKAGPPQVSPGSSDTAVGCDGGSNLRARALGTSTQRGSSPCQDVSAEGTTLNSTALLLILGTSKHQPRERKPPPSLPV